MVKNTYVIIPAYNEEKNISKAVRNTKKYSQNIIVVDDGSQDRTKEFAIQNNVIVLRHEKNAGKGVALKTGCEFALKKGAQILVLIDADNQHDPSLIPKFVDTIRNKKVNIVFGTRKLGGQMPVVYRFGNWFLNKIIAILCGINLRDTQCGFRAFTSQAYKKIRWQSKRYAAESEVVALVRKHKLRYAELEIPTIYHDKFKGTTPLDGIRILFSIVKWKIFRRRKTKR
ncbi:glycosyltransferase [Candidatus Woesearchaeota archaeon]|nr:glycosyltransferase [Candidatus Woesearchaeota archaeon]